MELSSRDGLTQRLIEVPLCAQCAGYLQRRSAAEERLQQLRWPFAAIAALFALGFVLLAVPSLAFWPSLLVALLAAAAVLFAVIRLVDHRMGKAALPEKRAVLASARLVSFTWRRATFEFANQIFIAGFVALNEQLLLSGEADVVTAAGEGNS